MTVTDQDSAVGEDAGVEPALGALLSRYLEDNISTEDRKLLFECIQSGAYDHVLADCFMDRLETSFHNRVPVFSAERDDIFRKVVSSRRLFFRRLAYREIRLTRTTAARAIHLPVIIFLLPAILTACSALFQVRPGDASAQTTIVSQTRGVSYPIAVGDAHAVFPGKTLVDRRMERKTRLLSKYNWASVDYKIIDFLGISDHRTMHVPVEEAAAFIELRYGIRMMIPERVRHVLLEVRPLESMELTGLLESLSVQFKIIYIKDLETIWILQQRDHAWKIPV